MKIWVRIPRTQNKSWAQQCEPVLLWLRERGTVTLRTEVGIWSATGAYESPSSPYSIKLSSDSGHPYFWMDLKPLLIKSLSYYVSRLPPNPVGHGLMAVVASKGPWPWDFSQGPSNQVKQIAYFIYSVPWAAATATVAWKRLPCNFKNEKCFLSHDRHFKWWAWAKHFFLGSLGDIFTVIRPCLVWYPVRLFPFSPQRENSTLPP